MKNIGNSLFKENLRRIRKSSGLTQSELAEKAGLSVRGYQKYEQGESIPRPESLEAIAQALGCTIGELYSEPTITMKDLANPSDEAIEKLSKRIAEHVKRQEHAEAPKTARGLLIDKINANLGAFDDEKLRVIGIMIERLSKIRGALPSFVTQKQKVK